MKQRMRFATIILSAAMALGPLAPAASAQPVVGRVGTHSVLLYFQKDLDEGRVTAAQIEQLSQCLDQSYDDFVNKQGFRAPIGVRIDGHFVARLEEFPGHPAAMLGYVDWQDKVIHLRVDAVAKLNPVVTHELFHTIQMAYAGVDQPWMMEATAEWAMFTRHPAELKTSWAEMNFLNHPELSLHDQARDAQNQLKVDRGRPYGTSLFFRYLRQHHPSGGGVVRQMLENAAAISQGRAGDSDAQRTRRSLTALGVALGGKDVFDPAARDWLERFAAACVLGPKAPAALLLPGVADLGGGSPYTYLSYRLERHLSGPFKGPESAACVAGPFELHGLGTRFFEITAPAAAAKDVDLDVAAPTHDGSVSLQALYHNGQDWITLRGTYEPSRGACVVRVPQLGQWRERVFLALTRFDADTSARQVPVSVAMAEPPVVTEIKVSQGEAAALHLTWEPTRDAYGRLSARTGREIANGKMDSAAGPAQVSIAFSRALQPFGDVPLSSFNGREISMTSQQEGRLWTGVIDASWIASSSASARLRVNGYHQPPGSSAGLPLDENPATVARLTWDRWSDYERSDAGMELKLATSVSAPDTIVIGPTRRSGKYTVIPVRTAALTELDASTDGRQLEIRVEAHQEVDGPPLNLSASMRLKAGAAIQEDLAADKEPQSLDAQNGRRVAGDGVLLFISDRDNPDPRARPWAPYRFRASAQWRDGQGSKLGPAALSEFTTPAQPVLRVLGIKETKDTPTIVAGESYGWSSFSVVMSQPDMAFDYDGAEVVAASDTGWNGRFWTGRPFMTHDSLQGVEAYKRDASMIRNNRGSSEAGIKVPYSYEGQMVRLTAEAGSQRAALQVLLTPDPKLLDARESGLKQLETTGAWSKAKIDAAEESRRECKRRTPELQAMVAERHKAALAAGVRMNLRKDDAELTTAAVRAIHEEYAARYALLLHEQHCGYGTRAALRESDHDSQTRLLRWETNWRDLLVTYQIRIDELSPDGTMAEDESSFLRRQLALWYDHWQSVKELGKEPAKDDPLVPKAVWDYENEEKAVKKRIAKLPVDFAWLQFGQMEQAIRAAGLAGDLEAVMCQYRAQVEMLAKYPPLAESAGSGAWKNARAFAKVELAALMAMLGGDRRAAAELYLQGVRERVDQEEKAERREAVLKERLRPQNLPAWWPGAE